MTITEIINSHEVLRRCARSIHRTDRPLTGELVTSIHEFVREFTSLTDEEIHMWLREQLDQRLQSLGVVTHV